jgi:hypothetical protein
MMHNSVLFALWGGFMRNLVLILIAFIAVVTFIRAFDNSETENMKGISETLIEFDTNN